MLIDQAGLMKAIEDICESLIIRMIVPTTIVLFMLAIFIGIPFAIYDSWKESKKPTFELKKDAWDCVRFHDDIYFNGKVYVHHRDCITWDHN